MSFGRTGQSFDQGQRKIHCRTRSARGDELAIFDDGIVLLFYLGERDKCAGETGGLFTIE